MTKKDILSKIPSSEIGWTDYFDRNHKLLFIVTSKETRDYYILYEVLENGFRRLGKAPSPIALEEKFKVIDQLSNDSR